jgi:hypothetical protein
MEPWRIVDSCNGGIEAQNSHGGSVDQWSLNCTGVTLMRSRIRIGIKEKILIRIRIELKRGILASIKVMQYRTRGGHISVLYL